MFPGSCCDLPQQGPAPALPSTLIPVGLVEFGPFEAALSPGAAHDKLQGEMEVPWATHSQVSFGSPLSRLEAQVMLGPCPPSAWSPSGLCQAGCALCMDMAALVALLQCTPPQFQMALQGLLPFLQELGHMEKGGSWGWYCPSVTGMLLWHLGCAVQRLLPHQPSSTEGLKAGVCSTSLGKLHLSPSVSTWLDQQLGLGRELLATILNPLATATKINPEVRFSSLSGWERVLA